MYSLFSIWPIKASWSHVRLPVARTVLIVHELTNDGICIISASANPGVGTVTVTAAMGTSITVHMIGAVGNSGSDRTDGLGRRNTNRRCRGRFRNRNCRGRGRCYHEGSWSRTWRNCVMLGRSDNRGVVAQQAVFLVPPNMFPYHFS